MTLDDETDESAIELAKRKRHRRGTRNILDAYRRYKGNPRSNHWPGIAVKATQIWRNVKGIHQPLDSDCTVKFREVLDE